MSRGLLLFESAGWRDLRPLTDLVPVPALAFGASSLGARWRRTSGLEPLGDEVRAELVHAVPEAASAAHGPDELLVLDAALLPGPWLAGVLEADPPFALECEGCIVGALAARRVLASGLGHGVGLEAFLAGLELPRRPVAARRIVYPWHLIEWNAEAIAEDLGGVAGSIGGEFHPAAVVIEPGRVTVEPGARVDPFALLDARGGPILVAAGAVVGSHTVVVGPCVVGPGTHLLGGSVGRSTIGPQCRIAGEVEECVWQGYANKRHQGFVGHSLIGEWVNLGALTTTSDLKNNYGSVRMWVDGREIDSGVSKVGSVIGSHVKTGIGTLLPTGASIGVGSNLFGGGRFAPKLVPAFSWWDGECLEEHRFEPFLKTARITASRRGREISGPEEARLRRLFEVTAGERRGAARPQAAAPPGAGRGPVEATRSA